MVKTERAGRPRQDGERFPCGKLKPRLSGAELRRIIDHARLTANDPRLGSEIGRLTLTGKLSADEAATAIEIGDIYGAFDRFEGKRRAARSPAYEVAFGRATHPESEEFLKAHAEAKRRFRFLEQRLSDYPARARAIIEALCVENLTISSGDPDLMESLRALLQHIATELERFDIEAAKRAARERQQARRKTRQERLEADDYVIHAGDAPPGEADKRQRRREARIGEILARDRARVS